MPDQGTIASVNIGRRTGRVTRPDGTTLPFLFPAGRTFLSGDQVEYEEGVDSDDNPTAFIVAGGQEEVEAMADDNRPDREDRGEQRRDGRDRGRDRDNRRDQGDNRGERRDERGADKSLGPVECEFAFEVDRISEGGIVRTELLVMLTFTRKQGGKSQPVSGLGVTLYCGNTQISEPASRPVTDRASGQVYFIVSLDPDATRCDLRVNGVSGVGSPCGPFLKRWKSGEGGKQAQALAVNYLGRDNGTFVSNFTLGTLTAPKPEGKGAPGTVVVSATVPIEVIILGSSSASPLAGMSVEVPTGPSGLATVKIKSAGGTVVQGANVQFALKGTDETLSHYVRLAAMS